MFLTANTNDKLDYIQICLGRNFTTQFCRKENNEFAQTCHIVIVCIPYKTRFLFYRLPNFIFKISGMEDNA